MPNVEQAVACGRRDGARAVDLAKEEWDSELEVARLPAHVMGLPDPGEPGTVARRLCSDWDDTTDQGIYVGPRDLPIGGRISNEAGKAARSADHVWDAYWDAFELTLRRANVALLLTYFDTEERSHLRSLYVVDNDRFPVWNGKNLTGYTEDGDTLIEETCVQIAYLPETRRIRDKIRGVFRR